MAPRVIRFRDRKSNGGYQGLEGVSNGELLFNRYIASALQDGKSSGDEW